MKWNKSITTAQEHDKALKRLSSIFDTNPDSPEGMEAELLVTLIDKFEKEHYPIALPEPITAIKEYPQTSH
ncbi:putative transcription regulator containing HTH domain protein [Cecembia lonarensis LW9]|uniref:Putative transcription regulator containing HTH domain protein n=1 Tax=Cecembia lonarensis (strain CCUG 58316 / KCTC 22772 / LW9) TaxID=1225176 RepID=K1LI35_CECL9|nr:putative transcription regulator containing HTH domain protein [Cecembia lonarensis LW9]